MSEYQYNPYPPINKEIHSSYPIPKCEPKKLTQLPPAANVPDLGHHPSLRFRNSEKPRTPKPPRTIPDLPYSKGYSQHTDQNSTSTSPRTNRRGSSSRQPPASAADHAASASGTSRNADGAAGSSGECRQSQGECPHTNTHSHTHHKGKSYGAPNAARRGSTIPRQGKANSVRSPLSRSGAAGYGGTSRSRGAY